MKSFHNSAILIITKILTDEGGDLYILPHFKDQIVLSIKPTFKEDFNACLKQVRFDQGVKNLLKQAKALRVNFIAYTTRDLVLGKIELSYFSIPKLKKLLDKLNSFFNVLSFDFEHIMLPIPYDHFIISSYKTDTDIEKILDYIIKDSHVLNMSEQNPNRWQIHRKKLDKDKLKILNQYRKKFNLPKV
jgi:hypothetical protein